MVTGDCSQSLVLPSMSVNRKVIDGADGGTSGAAAWSEAAAFGVVATTP
jgi:hypothetical protein